MKKISGIPRVGRLDRENRPGKEEELGFKQIFFRNILNTKVRLWLLSVSQSKNNDGRIREIKPYESHQVFSQNRAKTISDDVKNTVHETSIKYA
jgi:hypothetical protein